jgi:dUTP pyrophosphatase
VYESHRNKSQHSKRQNQIRKSGLRKSYTLKKQYTYLQKHNNGGLILIFLMHNGLPRFARNDGMCNSTIQNNRGWKNIFFCYISSMTTTSIIICVAHEGQLPQKHTPGAVCRDLSINKDIELKPWEIILATTGVKIACPAGRHTKIYARSWLPIKSGLMLANSVGVIDNDYRGDYLLQLYNFTDQPVTLPATTRVAQLEIVPYFLPEQPHTLIMPPIEIIIDPDVFARFEELYPTSRGAKGFHSTGR